MHFNIVISGVQRLPNAVEIGMFAARSPRGLVICCVSTKACADQYGDHYLYNFHELLLPLKAEIVPLALRSVKTKAQARNRRPCCDMARLDGQQLSFYACLAASASYGLRGEEIDECKAHRDE